MTLKVIENDAELEEMAARLEAIDMKEHPTKEELDLAGVLDLLIHQYDSKIELPDQSPLDMLKFLMDARDLTQADITPLLGSRGTASEVLASKRGLSLAMVRKLSDFFHVSTDLFIAKNPDETKKTRTNRTTSTKKRTKPPVGATR